MFRRLVPAYAAYSLFQRPALEHNLPHYEELGLNKRYWSPVSSADFAGLHPQRQDTVDLAALDSLPAYEALPPSTGCSASGSPLKTSLPAMARFITTRVAMNYPTSSTPTSTTAENRTRMMGKPARVWFCTTLMSSGCATTRLRGGRHCLSSPFTCRPVNHSARQLSC